LCPYLPGEEGLEVTEEISKDNSLKLEHSSEKKGAWFSEIF
jgi:hypothetical protein